MNILIGKKEEVSLYCIHVGELLEFKSNKMELIKQSNKKCDCCPTQIICETYVCPKCGKEILVNKNIIDLNFEARFEESQKNMEPKK